MIKKALTLAMMVGLVSLFLGGCSKPDDTATPAATATTASAPAATATTAGATTAGTTPAATATTTG